MLKYYLLLTLLGFNNAQWFFHEKSNVLDYTWTHLKQLIHKTDDLFLVQFYEHQNEKCRDFAMKYERIAEGLRGFARVAAVDINQIYGNLPISAIPAFGIFSTNRSEMTLIKGKKTSRKLVDAVFIAADKMVERELSRSLKLVNPVALDIMNYEVEVLDSMSLWLVAFLGSGSNEMAEIWDEVSRIMKIQANFGYVDKIIFKKYALEYDIENESTIVCFPRGAKRKERVINYIGAITLDKVLEWVSYMIHKPQDIIQITTKNIFIQTCRDYENCGILFIPEIVVCGRQCRSGYLNILKNLSYKYMDFSWLWSEAVAQISLEKTFNINHTYPTLVILDFMLKNYTTLRGFHAEGEVDEFVENVVKGNERAPPYEMIKVLKYSRIQDVDPWEE